MVQTSSAHSVATLRAISYRITATPSKDLPLIVGQITGSLWNCKDILSASSEALKVDSEASTGVHRFKTSLNSLLQDKTSEGRWAGVVLTKATIEAGGLETLSKSSNWVKHLLTVLKKNDPPTTRNLAIITWTRIFMLTWDHSNLVREITTPNLPTFISICLSNVEKDRCSGSELQTVLQAFATLVPRHPTIFRTNESHIRSLLIKVLSFNSSLTERSKHYTRDHRQSAQKLLVLLHHCAPKQGGSAKWDETLTAAMNAAHATCDRLFRSVVEQWQPATNNQRILDPLIISSTEPEFDGEDPLGLRQWRGVLAGEDRLITLLGIVTSHLQTSTASSVSLRLGSILDLLSRLFSLTIPTQTESVKANNQIPKEERNMLFTILPSIHVAALEVVDAVLSRLDHASAPLVQSLQEPMIDVFRSERFDDEVRTWTYTALRRILGIMGPGMAKADVAELAPIIKGCCEDLLPTEERTSMAEGSSRILSGGVPSYAAKKSSAHSIIAKPNHVMTAAEILLSTLLSRLNAAHVPRKLRVQMERTAILTRNKNAMIACVMNPARKNTGTVAQTSLLPLLVREYPQCAEVEALLRPRVQPLNLKGATGGEAYVNGVDEEAEDSDDTSDHDQVAAQSIQGQENDPSQDFLKTLGQTRSGAFVAADEDDLYSATPPRDVPPTAQSQELSRPEDELGTIGIKRVAPTSAEGSEISAKRLRPSSVAAAVLDEPLVGLPAPGPGDVQSAFVGAISAGQERLHSNVGTESETAASKATLADDAGFARGVAPDVASDDSDFEMPPLTMEPDTDPEDEDDDEQEED